MQEVFLVIVVAGLLYTLLASIIAIRELRPRRYPHTRSGESPPVSILKPLKGIDDSLRSNLESFFRIDYPEYELIFGVAEEDDPAVELVRELQRRFPVVKSRLVIDNSRIGLNPKINNLHNIYSNASFDYIIVSDSNVLVGRDYIDNMIRYAARGDVGLVTSIIRGSGARTMGAVMENIHLNTYVASNTFAVARIFNIPISTGKSICIRREILEAAGGFRRFRDFLLEDELLAQTVKSMGLKTVISPHPVDNINTNMDTRQFIGRNLRWAIMRRKLSLLHYSVEIFSNPVFASFLMVSIFQDPLSIYLMCITAFSKTTLDYSVSSFGGLGHRPWHNLLMPLKDLIIGFIWIAGFFRRRVSWRGNKFSISARTAIITEHRSWPARLLHLRILAKIGRITLTFTRRLLTIFSQ